MKENKKNTTEKVTTIQNLTISKASEVLVNLNSTAKEKTQSLTDLHLHKFLIIEGEEASKMGRTSLVVTFADLINTPFRTVESKIGTVVQVSSQWLKQLDVHRVLNSFRDYCASGHVVTTDIQATFDTTFTRPCFTYTCKCGVQFTKSYRMRKEAEHYACKCGTLVKDMVIS